MVLTASEMYLCMTLLQNEFVHDEHGKDISDVHFVIIMAISLDAVRLDITHSDEVKVNTTEISLYYQAGSDHIYFHWLLTAMLDHCAWRVSIYLVYFKF